VKEFNDNQTSSDLKTYRSNFTITKDKPWLRISDQQMLSFNLAESGSYSNEQFANSKLGIMNKGEYANNNNININKESHILTIENLEKEE